MEGIVSTATIDRLVQGHADNVDQACFPFATPTASQSTPSQRVDKDTFKQIFRDHWDSFRTFHPRFDTPYHNSVLQKMLDCGDPEKMGYVQYRCCGCGETQRIAFTCKSSFCLSCSKLYTDQWADFIGRRLFPGLTYRHIVLTMPDSLRIYFYREPELLSQFMQTGYACLKDIFDTTSDTHLDIGAIMVLQTFGRSGEYNPHLHILITAGGLNPKRRWRTVRFIPFDLMHKKWQYHLLTMLRNHVHDPHINRDVDLAWRKYPNGFVAYLQPGDVPPGGQGLAQYLAKYVVSPPISIRRIEHYDGKTVRYWYKDHKTEQIQHQTLPALRFIGRMVQHILPKGFQRIRYYGLHWNGRYEEVRQQLDHIVPPRMPVDPRGYRILPAKQFAQRFLDSFGRDPLVCPKCGNPMEPELIVHPSHGIIRELWPIFQEASADDRSEPTLLRTKGGARHTVPGTDDLVQLPLPFL